MPRAVTDDVSDERKQLAYDRYRAGETKGTRVCVHPLVLSGDFVRYIEHLYSQLGGPGPGTLPVTEYDEVTSASGGSTLSFPEAALLQTLLTGTWHTHWSLDYPERPRGMGNAHMIEVRRDDADGSYTIGHRGLTIDDELILFRNPSVVVGARTLDISEGVVHVRFELTDYMVDGDPLARAWRYTLYWYGSLFISVYLVPYTLVPDGSAAAAE